MDELNAKLIPGTEENTSQPVFSPDGKWIGYFAINDKKLKKIAISGGAPVVFVRCQYAFECELGCR